MIKTQEALMQSITIVKSSEEERSDVEALQEMEDTLEMQLVEDVQKNADYEDQMALTNMMELEEQIEARKQSKKDKNPPSIKEESGLTDMEAEEQQLDSNLMADKGMDQGTNSYEVTYIKTIERISELVHASERSQHSLEKITSLRDQVWSLVDEWRNQGKETQKKCYRQTLLKGIIALMDNKNHRAILRLCSGALHIFNALYTDKLKLSPQERK